MVIIITCCCCCFCYFCCCVFLNLLLFFKLFVVRFLVKIGLCLFLFSLSWGYQWRLGVHPESLGVTPRFSGLLMRFSGFSWRNSVEPQDSQGWTPRISGLNPDHLKKPRNGVLWCGLEDDLVTSLAVVDRNVREVENCRYLMERMILPSL